ncbi:MAG: hypothetical protein ACFE9Z_08190 [Promethearchaeota archaeon]
MNELSEISVKNQVINNMRQEFEGQRPNSNRILKTLLDLRTKGKSQQVSDSEFFDIVGETFNMAPDFFMKELYESFMVKIGKIIGTEKRQQMERYIIEKFCLDEDEKILYVCKADVKLTEMLEQEQSGKMKGGLFGIRISVSSGDVFITNQRLIAHGFFKVKGGESQRWFVWGPGSLWIFTGGSKRRERQKELFESTPFGYQFPIKNHWGLGKVKLLHVVGYNFFIKNRICVLTIKPLDKQKREQHLNNIFNLLRKDVEEILALIQGIFEFDKGEKFKKRFIPNIIKSLHKTEEYNDLSDLDYLNIVKETYKIDSEFFMSIIYPKMMSWDFPSFMEVKDSVKETLMNEGANIT